jgi:hypothetical protein
VVLLQRCDDTLLSKEGDNKRFLRRLQDIARSESDFCLGYRKSITAMNASVNFALSIARMFVVAQRRSVLRRS